MFAKKTVLFCALSLCLSTNIIAQDTPASPPSAEERRPGASAFRFGGGQRLGVHVEDVTRENMSRFNLQGEPRGVAVTNVLENSPAAKAGLQKNDVILRFDGESVTSAQKLRRLISESAPEHAARLVVNRSGAEQEISVTLGKQNDFRAHGLGNITIPDMQEFRFNTDELKRNAEEWKKQAQEEWERNSGDRRRELEKFRADGLGNNNFAFVFGQSRRLGITTQPLTGQLADYFGLGERSGGVLVTSVVENSPAAKAGLKAGDCIIEVDGTPLKSAGELSRAVNRKETGEVTLTLMRDKKRRTVKVTPDRTQNPTLFTPGGGELIAPMALSAPRPNSVPRPLLPALPRLNAAPRLPLAPLRVRPPRPGTWVL